MTLIDILTKLDGRIGRKKYWIGLAVLVGFIILVTVAMMAVFGSDVLEGPYSGYSGFLLALGIVSLIVSIPLMLKRLHDLNRSIGLLIPAFILEPVSAIGNFTGLTGTATDLNTAGHTLLIVNTLYALALFIYTGFYRGTRGPNDFGPDPLAGEENPATVNP